MRPAGGASGGGASSSSSGGGGGGGIANPGKGDYKHVYPDKTFQAQYIPDKDYTYDYSDYKTPATEFNEYLDMETWRTYEPLYLYYKAPGFQDEEGYLSPMYNQTYFDGYGYDFYYGGKGYYEYSVHPSEMSQNMVLAIGAGILLAICCLPCCIFFCMKGAKASQNMNEDSMSDVVPPHTQIVEEHVEQVSFAKPTASIYSNATYTTERTGSVGLKKVLNPNFSKVGSEHGNLSNHSNSVQLAESQVNRHK